MDLDTAKLRMDITGARARRPSWPLHVAVYSCPRPCTCSIRVPHYHGPHLSHEDIIAEDWTIEGTLQ